MGLDDRSYMANPRSEGPHPPRSNVSLWQRIVAIVLLIVFLGGVVALVI